MHALDKSLIYHRQPIMLTFTPTVILDSAKTLHVPVCSHPTQLLILVLCLKTSGHPDGLVQNVFILSHLSHSVISMIWTSQL